MSSHVKKPVLATLAFLFVCLSLVSSIFFYERWKAEQLRESVVVVPELKSATPAMGHVLLQESFASLSNWREEVRSGKTIYTSEKDKSGAPYLRAHSTRSASLLVKKISYSPYLYPILKWSWKVEKMSVPADMKTLEGSDAPARIYVAFKRGIGLWDTRLINYVWASSMEKDSIIQSFLSPNSRILVLESGLGKADEWIDEERNVLEDYRRLYGEDPPAVSAIAVMSDTDNTRSEAIACYRDLVVSS